MFTSTITQRSTDGLPLALSRELWQLYQGGYNTDFDTFHNRWNTLDRVALFHHRASGELLGFIGFRFRRFELASGTVPTLYFGQAYIRPENRGKLLVQRLVIGLFLRMKIRQPLTRCYFWADALTYTPYLGMANNLADYYPHPDKPAPASVTELVNAVGERYYPELFDAATGTVRKPRNVLADESVVITEADLGNRFIRFYAQKNPGHGRGDGLILTCPMSLKNLFYFLVKRRKKIIAARSRASHEDRPVSHSQG